MLHHNLHSQSAQPLPQTLYFVLILSSLQCKYKYGFIWSAQRSSFFASQCSLFNGGIKPHPLIHPLHMILLTPSGSSLCYSNRNQHSIYYLESTHEYG